jgi:50S ribosomal protein L16 3-hydroxylase
MRLWSPEAAAACGIEERTLDYDDHLDWALQIEGRTDGIIYWPPSYWHVGESPGLSVSINVNFLASTQGESDWTHVQPLLSVIRQHERCQSLRPSLPFAQLDSARASGEMALPESLHDAIDGVRAACASAAFARGVVAEWLGHISRHGFGARTGHATSNRAGRLAETETVQAVPAAPVYWVRHEGSIVWACRGASGTLVDAEVGERILQRLVRGEPVPVGVLLAESAADDVKALLEQLVAVGGLVYVVGAPAAQPPNVGEAGGAVA